MPFQTTYLDLDNATLNEEEDLVVNVFKTVSDSESDVLVSGQPVRVLAEVAETKTISGEYIASAIAACEAVDDAPRHQEWLDVKSKFDQLSS